MQKLPKNYKKLTAELKQVVAEYNMGIDFAMLEMDGHAYGFKQLEEFNPRELSRQTNEKDELDFQNCFNQLTETAEKFGFSLALIRLTSNTGAKMIVGTLESYKKYGDAHAQISKH